MEENASELAVIQGDSEDPNVTSFD